MGSVILGQPGEREKVRVDNGWFKMKGEWRP